MLSQLPKSRSGTIMRRTVLRLSMVRLILLWRTHPAETGHAHTPRYAPVRR